MLTKEAIAAIEGARLIYGSRRAIELAGNHIQSQCYVSVIQDYRKLKELPDEAVVLSTGDPMLGGLGYLGGKVIPGISSLQVACARLGLSMLSVTPMTAHGRKLDPGPVVEELQRGKNVFLLIDEATDLSGLCLHLEDAGLGKDLAVLTDLGYPEERIAIGSTSNALRAPGLSCVMIGKFSGKGQR